MNIDEAILDLASIPPWPNENNDPHYLDAIKLGIEALKFMIRARDQGWIKPLYTLPGETID